MPTTWIDIADSAVKIGLGGLIGGIATLIAGQQKNRHEIRIAKATAERGRESELRTNRRRLIENAAPVIEKFFRIHDKLAIEVLYAAEEAQRLVKEHGSLSPAGKAKLANGVEEICSGEEYFEALHDARAQMAVLKLAAANEAVDVLADAYRACGAFRDGLFEDDFVPTVETANSRIGFMRQKRKEFESLLSDYYSKM